MATRLLYLEDFGVMTCDAQIVELGQAEDGRSIVILDQTCFYPRGGGQDWDTGVIATEMATFMVEEVRLDQAGTVQHIGMHKQGTMAQGERVHGEVDAVRRSVNTRLHSAGHVVDMAVQQLDFDWVPGRGAHYPHMSFVEYSGTTRPDDTVKQKLQEKINELLERDYENKILFMPVAEMSQYCRYVPENIPKNKPSRIVLYADNFGIPCGGTHVRTAREIGAVTITKLKAKGELIKVSYAVSDIN